MISFVIKKQAYSLNFWLKWALFKMINFVIKRQAYSLTFWLKIGTFQDDQFCDNKASL